MTLSFLSMNRWTRLLAFAPLVAVFMLAGDTAPRLAAVDDTPTAVTLTVLSTGGSCGRTAGFALTVGGVNAGTLPAAGDCTTAATADSMTTTAPAVLAQVAAPACMDLNVAMTAGSSYVSWVRVDVTRNSGTQSNCLFDHNGGTCTVNNLGSANYIETSGQSWSIYASDTDGDGSNNCVDTDLDGDGINNAADFCPAFADASNTDTDNDGVGDACETLTVRTVPWLGLPNKPHEVYSGGAVILQGVASVGYSDTPAVGLVSAVWDPGDGSSVVSVPVGNPLALELTKTYTGADDQPFTATLTVTNNLGEVKIDTFKVVIKAKNIDVEANMAIDKGLWYMHKQVTRQVEAGVPVGFISGTSNIATTSASLQAFQINNHVTTGQIAQDPYIPGVSRMLRWLEGRIQVQALNLQNGNNPDTNGNNKGLFANDNSVNYIVGQVMDAFVSSGTPTRTAILGPAGDVKGRTYAAIVQDMMDFNNWSQIDTGVGRGSWHYTASNNTSTGHDDNSIAQWPAIGGIAAERVWGLTTPSWVKTDVKNFLPLTYNAGGTIGAPALSTAGAFGYSSSNNLPWSEGFSTTPSALVQYIWAGVAKDATPDDAHEQKLMDGFNFVARYQRVRNYYACCDTYAGGINYYGLYATTKAYRLALNESGSPEAVTTVDDNPSDSVPAWNWYYNDPAAGAPASAGPIGVARAVIGNQQASGQFPGGSNWSGNLSTAWGVIILSPSLFQLGPTASCTANPNQIGSFGGTVNFNGTGSFHNDNAGTIVSYEWDFGDSSSGTGSTASHGYPSRTAFPHNYNATLTVTDSNGLSDTASCPVTQVDTNVQPNAETGGPYTFCQGTTMIVNGSASSDPEDGSAIAFNWDFVAPINFLSAGASTASVNVTSIFGAMAPGTYDIGLRVTDSLGVTNSEFSTVTVLAANNAACNQPPDAVNDSATTPSGTPVTIAVLANDTDPDRPPQTLTVTATTQGTNGTVSTDGTTATYTPALGFFGVDTFTYTISDGRGGVDTATVTVTVNRRLATVTAGTGSKVYGDADPALSPSSSGFLEAMTLSQTRAAGEDVGNYATTATAAGATLGNYNVTYIPGNLEITPAAVTATAGNGSSVYDGAVHAASACVVTGAYTGDLTCANNPATAGPNVGTTTMSPAVSGSGLGNYTITSVDGSYEITKASATVTAGSGTKVYGTADPALSPSSAGFLEAMTLSQTRAAGEDVGNYATTATALGATLGNYNVIYVPGNLEITPKAATVTAGSGTKVYGTADPALSPSSSGFLEAMTLSQTRAAGEDVGNYATTATAAGATLGNYSVTYLPGNLGITKAPTVTTLSTPSPQAAGAPVTLTATVVAVAPTVGVPNGTVTFMEGATVLGTAPVNGSGVAVFTTTSLALGPHSITANYGGSPNYFPSGAGAVSQMIYGYSTGGGTFVIGNNNAILGGSVTFWGGQWGNLNSMTGGPANSSFKGFAIAPAIPTVGGTFTAAPGNSGPAPSAVPTYIGIIVTSQVTKSGSNITGTIVGMVVARVNPGYQSNPGSPGTGTIVAVIQ